MKHHIIFKFIAIVLCAAMLMGAVGSGLGILALTQNGLYGRDVEEAYLDFVDTHANALAEEIAHRQISMNLGGANSRLVDDVFSNYWSNRFFDLDKVSYTVWDESGNALASHNSEPEERARHVFTYDASEFGSYIRVLSETPEEEYYAANTPELTPGVTTQIGDSYVYNAIPEAGAEVYFVEIQQESGSWGVGSPEEPLGVVTRRADGYVEFHSEEGVDLLEDISLMTGILFMTRDRTCIYEASNPDGILQEGSWTGSYTYLLLRQLEETTFVMDAIPPEGCEVIRVSMTYDNGHSESTGGTPSIGYLDYEADGRVRFVSNVGITFSCYDTPVTHIVFYDQNDSPVYEARDPEGVGFFSDHGEEIFFLSSGSTPEVEEESAEPAEMGAKAVVKKRTPIRTYYDGEFEQQKYYFGKDYDITIYAVRVFDGALYGCTDEIYLTHPDAPCQWVAMEDVEILSYVASVTDKGRPALCLTETEVWALDGADFYETGMRYQKGQQINILILGTFDSGEWGMTDMGWVRLETISWLEDTPAVASLEETVPATEAPLIAELFQAEVQQDIDIYSAPSITSEILGIYHQGELVSVTQTRSAADGEWALTDRGWIPMEYLVPVELPVAEFPISYIEETVVPAVEATIPAVTEEATASVTEQTVPGETPLVPTEPVLMDYGVAEASLGDVNIYGYWDYNTQQSMIVEYVYEDMPAYTVELQLWEGAIRSEYSWVAARALYAYRNQLPWLLGICLLLFAVFAVYLCCAAGRKPGTNAVRFEGLNRIPLDLYAVLTVAGVAFACALIAAGPGEYLLESSIRIGLLFAALVAYAACLLIVGFCYACAAQFKTPGGYWWRHSVCFLSLRFGAFLCRKLLRFTVWLTKKCETTLWPWLVRLCKAAVKVVAALLKLGGTCLGRLVIWAQKWGDWLWSKLTRFFALLPLTWQWLLGGGIMIFFLFITVAGRYDMGIILSILFGIGLVMYGAHFFGTLLESVKKMSKGDLDEKVDDKLMVGAFKDFAGELNSLADVAVVAAQKQLKSERMKTELITNVSHDIKTPLTSIINYVDLLQKPHSDADQEKYLEVLDRQSQRLKKLIDDLMEMSKASTGNMAVETIRLDAAEAVNQALGEFADKLERAQLYPVFRQPEETVYMMADGRLVWRVMSNLLSNAVKYALPGTRVYVDLQKLENKVIISMKNISREALNVEADELLERFVRGDASRNTEGSGLGLNIAQSLMELQKGQLQILVDGDLFKVTLIFPGVE